MKNNFDKAALLLPVILTSCSLATSGEKAKNFKNESVSSYRDSMKYFTARQLLYRNVGVLA